MGTLTKFEAANLHAERILTSFYDDETGEISTETAAELDRMDAIIMESADTLLGVIRQAELRAHICQAEANRLRAKAVRHNATSEYLRTRIMQVMKARGLKKIETDFNRLAIINNGGILPLVVPDGIKLPRKYIKVITHEANDYGLIRKAVEAGDEQLKELGVHLGERGQRLSIK